MLYKLNNKIIENGTYVLTKTELWLWCAKDSNWINQPIVGLNYENFIKMIHNQISKLSEQNDLLDFDRIIEEASRL